MLVPLSKYFRITVWKQNKAKKNKAYRKWRRSSKGRLTKASTHITMK